MPKQVPISMLAAEMDPVRRRPKMLTSVKLLKQFKKDSELPFRYLSHKPLTSGQLIPITEEWNESSLSIASSVSHFDKNSPRDQTLPREMVDLNFCSVSRKPTEEQESLVGGPAHVCLVD